MTESEKVAKLNEALGYAQKEIARLQQLNNRFFDRIRRDKQRIRANDEKKVPTMDPPRCDNTTHCLGCDTFFGPDLVSYQSDEIADIVDGRCPYCGSDLTVGITKRDDGYVLQTALDLLIESVAVYAKSQYSELDLRTLERALEAAKHMNAGKSNTGEHTPRNTRLLESSFEETNNEFQKIARKWQLALHSHEVLSDCVTMLENHMISQSCKNHISVACYGRAYAVWASKPYIRPKEVL